MILEPIDEVGVERCNLYGAPESSVIDVPAGTARNLPNLGRCQIAMRLAVEFADTGKRDVVEVEIESHADGVSRHQEVDVAVLIERDLRVAGAGAERAEHHGGAATL